MIRGDAETADARDLGGRVASFAVCFVLGAAAGGRGLPIAAAATASAAGFALLLWTIRARRTRAAGWVAVATAMPLAAWWAGLDGGSDPARLRAMVPEGESVLARVTGVVRPTVRTIEPDREGMGRFDFTPPGTAAELAVETVRLGGGPIAVDGSLVMRLKEHDTRLRAGMRVEATGWLRAIEPPSNPGAFDYRRWLERRGVVGRVTLPSRENWRELDTPWWHGVHWLNRVRAAVGDACLGSLREGLRDAGPSLGLLEALLLGHWGGELGELPERFRTVGLAHVLSISGAHLGILLGLVWLVVRLIVPHPPRAALVVLVVLLMYVMALPLRTPIARAAIMAGVFCVGYAVGRRPSPLGLLGVAAVAVLLWRPGDVATAGFQLSFGVVGALLLWTPTVSAMLLPPPVIEPVVETLGQRAARLAADYAAVSLIAFGVSMPVVAWHYELVSPWAVVMSVLSLPVLIAVLGLGYVKIAAGLIAGPMGGLLAGPLRWIADTMIALVEGAAAWPAAGVELASRPPVGWVLAALAVAAAWCGGEFRGRVGAGAAALAVVIVTLWGSTAGGPVRDEPVDAESGGELAGDAVAARVTMLAVGDGSCFVVEWPGHAWLFDCGSQAYFDVGERDVAPALDAMGVDRLDAVVVSHADLDHFNGVLDVVDAVPTRRVLVTPQLLDAAAADPGSPVAFLVAELRARGLDPRPVSAGWREAAGPVAVEALWPPRDGASASSNDRSLVLAFEISTAAGVARRALLSGDIQRDAKPALLDLHDAGAATLDADVADLPHHGSFVDASPRWLAAVSPDVVLQSTGHARLRRDAWAATLDAAEAARYATPRHGATTVTVHHDGTLGVTTFREPVRH